MKPYFFILAIFVSACSSNSTSPPSPTHPFPQAFRQVIVEYNDIPEHWSSEQNSWDNINNTSTDTKDTGTRLFSDKIVFTFDSSSFLTDGDTLSGSGKDSYYGGWTIIATVDRDRGIIGSLELLYGHYDGGSYTTGYDEESNAVTLHQISYKADSVNQTSVQLSGQAIQTGLERLDQSSSSETAQHGPTGSGASSDQAWNGSFVSSSSLSIYFIP